MGSSVSISTGFWVLIEIICLKTLKIDIFEIDLNAI